MNNNARRSRALGILAGLCAAVVVVLVVLTLTRLADLTDAIRQTQQAGVARAEKRDEQLVILKKQLAIVKRTATQVESCTTPGEPCARRGQRQTAEAIGAINANQARAAAAASSCAATLPDPTYGRVYRCTVSTLRHAGGRAP